MGEPLSSIITQWFPQLELSIELSIGVINGVINWSYQLELAIGVIIFPQLELSFGVINSMELL